MTKEIYLSNAEEEHKIELYTNLNVTVENEKELFFKYFDNQTNEMDSSLSFRSVVLSEKAMTFPPFVDVDTNKVADISFQTRVANSSYIAFTQDSTGVMEMIVGSRDQFVVKVYSIKDKSLTIFSYSRARVIPELTFFQKYGNLIMMSVMMIIQMFMNRNQPQQQTEEEQKNEESTENTENKEKTELYVCFNIK